MQNLHTPGTNASKEEIFTNNKFNQMSWNIQQSMPKIYLKLSELLPAADKYL
jgi:hypothetical protein